MLRRNLRSSAVAFLAPDALEAIKKCLTEVIPAFVAHKNAPPELIQEFVDFAWTQLHANKQCRVGRQQTPQKAPRQPRALCTTGGGSERRRSRRLNYNSSSSSSDDEDVTDERRVCRAVTKSADSAVKPRSMLSLVPSSPRQPRARRTAGETPIAFEAVATIGDCGRESAVFSRGPVSSHVDSELEGHIFSTPPLSPPPESRFTELHRSGSAVHLASRSPTLDAPLVWSDDGHGINRSTPATSTCASPSYSGLQDWPNEGAVSAGCFLDEPSLCAPQPPLHASLDHHRSSIGECAPLEEDVALAWETSPLATVTAASARQQVGGEGPSSRGESVVSCPLVVNESYAAIGTFPEADAGAEDCLRSLVNLASCRGPLQLSLEYVGFQSQEDIRRRLRPFLSSNAEELDHQVLRSLLHRVSSQSFRVLDADRFADVDLRHSIAHLDLASVGLVLAPEDDGFILPYLYCANGEGSEAREEGLLIVDLTGRKVVAFGAQDEGRTWAANVVEYINSKSDYMLGPIAFQIESRKLTLLEGGRRGISRGMAYAWETEAWFKKDETPRALEPVSLRNHYLQLLLSRFLQGESRLFCKLDGLGVKRAVEADSGSAEGPRKRSRLHIDVNATPPQRLSAHDVSPLASPQLVLADESVVLPPIFTDAVGTLAKEDDRLRNALCSAYQDHRSFGKKFTDVKAVRILQMILECATTDHLFYIMNNLQSFPPLEATGSNDDFQAWATAFRKCETDLHEQTVRIRLLDHKFWQYTETRRVSYQQKWAAERRVKGRSGFIASNSVGVTAKAQVKKWVAEVGLQDRAERGRMFDELVRAYDNVWFLALLPSAKCEPRLKFPPHDSKYWQDWQDWQGWQDLKRWRKLTRPIRPCEYDEMSSVEARYFAKWVLKIRSDLDSIKSASWVCRNFRAPHTQAP